MGFFVDRLVEHPGRIKLTDTTSGNEQIVDVTREEGVITEPGTLLNATNLNYGTTLGQVQFDPTAAPGTTDGDLHTLLNTVGWESDVMDADLLNLKKLMNKILDELPITQTGYFQGEVAANAYKDYPIVFPNAYSSAPTVVTQMVSTSTSATMGSISLATTNTSATGCTIRIFNNTSAQRSPAVRWLAVGKILF